MEHGFQKTQQPENQRNHHTIKIKHQEVQSHAVSISSAYMPAQTSELSTGLLGWDRRIL